MFKRVFLAVAAIASLACFSAPAEAKIVLSTSSSVVGNSTSAFVTIELRAITSEGVTNPPLNPPDPRERVGYYNFRLNIQDISGSGISGLSAVYDTTSAWSGLTAVDLDPVLGGVNPGISGTQITFQAGSATNIFAPQSTDPESSIIGTVTFTVNQNGNFGLSFTELSTPVTTGATGVSFARNSSATVIFALNRELNGGSPITVSGITAVPEPSSILLIGVAVAGLGGVRLRKRLLGKAQKA